MMFRCWCCVLVLTGVAMWGQGGTPKVIDSEWPAYGGDAGGTRYSPLKQIHTGNVSKLKAAWTVRTGDVSDGSDAGAKRIRGDAAGA